MASSIIDAHAHLWLRQDTLVEGKRILTLDNGKSEFMGETVQMLPPFLVDGRNTAEALIANMDYAQVAAAVITQEYIDGNQDQYLLDVQKRYPKRLLCCGLVEMRQPGFFDRACEQIKSGFLALKIPAQRLITDSGRISLVSDEAMRMYDMMQRCGIILSIDLADGDAQVGEMQEIIQQYPQLKIAIGHFAMVTRPGWTEQVLLARNPNVMIESGGITWLFHSEFYPYPGAIRAIREAADLVGWDHLMWGSDYPRTIVAITYRMSHDFVAKSPELTDAEKSAFLGANAQRFYGFEDLPQLPYIKNMSE